MCPTICPQHLSIVNVSLFSIQHNLIVKNRKYKNGICCDNRSRKYLKKKKKKKKSQINGTILIKKNSIEKNPKNMNKKKKDVKKTSYYVTRSRVKVHTIFF